MGGWVNDGFCDDGSNIAECDYDGGDCCLSTINNLFCDVCICHETGIMASTIPPTTTSQPWWEVEAVCHTHRIEMIGDGYCDDFNMNSECQFDGGDCCDENANFDYCLICECETQSSLECTSHTHWVGDGFCDDVTNNEACDFDGGDCCLSEINTSYCTICKCKEKSEPKV